MGIAHSVIGGGNGRRRQRSARSARSVTAVPSPVPYGSLPLRHQVIVMLVSS